MDRRQTVEFFRERLGVILDSSGLTRSAYAAAIGLDRSTLSQLLSPANNRLPRAETLAAMARQSQVSVDWLLGLTQEARLGADVLGQVLEIEPGGAAPADARLARWHAEAVGYKIRYVPTGLPDLFKTEDVIRYEFREYAAPVPEARIEQAGEQLAYSRRPETDMEVCCSRQTLEVFALGQGVWSGLPPAVRRAQLQSMVTLCEELYPTFRWFLYDGLRHFSVPLTIFGPKRAVVYLGNMYFVFNSTEHIRVLTRRFDDLIRAATIQPTAVAGYLESLLERIDASSQAGEGKA